MLNSMFGAFLLGDGFGQGGFLTPMAPVLGLARVGL